MKEFIVRLSEEGEKKEIKEIKAGINEKVVIELSKSDSTFSGPLGKIGLSIWEINGRISQEKGVYWINKDNQFILSFPEEDGYKVGDEVCLYTVAKKRGSEYFPPTIPVAKIRIRLIKPTEDKEVI